jgi:hypothetical protein
MPSLNREQALQRLLDKQDIYETLCRYARGVDRGDWDLVRSTYHEDAYDSHGDYQGDIKWKHLKDKKNPYNTRIHRGLPPTPIASPAKNSILAVLNPSNAGYYYYVREVGSDDRHVFSKTHAEHQAHVRRFVEWDRRVNAAKGKK